MQIVNGEEYRERSNTRLSRESILKAARGDILDQSGNKLATTKSGYVLTLYKTKVDNNTLNTSLLKIAKVLENNKDTYKDILPLKIGEGIEFTVGEEAQKRFKEQNNIDENKNAAECFEALKKKYEIVTDDLQDARRIMTLRYAIAKEGYSSTKTVELATNISQNSVAVFNERNDEFPGLTIQTVALRRYASGSLASHILGYVGRIDEKELAENEGYDLNDTIGKIGIEYIFEPYLKGKNGIKQIDMAVDRNTNC